MDNTIVDEKNKNIRVAIPLTQQTGKIRVKNKDIWYGYGHPVATRKQEFNNNFYIEWQIGYDVVVNDKDKLQLSTLPNKRFMGSNGKQKALFELSEYLYYFYSMNIINKDEIKQLLEDIMQIDDSKVIENNEELSVERSHPVEYKLEQINFQKSIVKYPLLLYKLSSFEIMIEIVVKEKQRAIGLQPMLYVCFPVTRLIPEGKDLIGRCAETNEKAFLILDQHHKDFILQTFKIFALLSKNHKEDVISIIKLILEKEML